jgi:hypothetical protein
VLCTLYFCKTLQIHSSLFIKFRNHNLLDSRPFEMGATLVLLPKCCNCGKQYTNNVNNGSNIIHSNNKYLLEEYRLIAERKLARPSPGELCWRERKLLVGPYMPGRSKGKGQTKWSYRSARFGVGCGANEPTAEKFAVNETYREHFFHGGCQDPNDFAALSKEQGWEWEWEWEWE